MKRFLILLGLLGLALSSFVTAQEDSLDWDINTIFDAFTEEDSPEEAEKAPPKPPAAPPAKPPAAPSAKTPAAPPAKTPAAPSGAANQASLVRPRGITFGASFEFLGGVAPGWNDTPWFRDEDDDLIRAPNVKMQSRFTIDAQISQAFRVSTLFSFAIPRYTLTLSQFFADYSLYDTVFFRAGKYSLSWGISPNFHITNLLSRIPNPKTRRSGDSFILRADIPLGIGGFQLLTQTRAALMTSDKIAWQDFGYGGKYNLALRWADFDLGAFYHTDMPFRGFLSIKTTIGNTELYNEWVAAGQVKEEKEWNGGAVNIGFAQGFFSNKFRVNGELLYNTEKDSFWYSSASSLRDPLSTPSVEGLNAALNMSFSFGGRRNPRLFLQTLYTPEERSTRLVPGLRLSPFPHADLYFAVPMALGGRTGYYYLNTPDPKNRPFCVVLLLSLTGSVRAGYYY